MAKTIKFNLICDNHQVRTLDDLRNHFSIEDVLRYYQDKVLEKWLLVRGYNEELESVKKITSTSSYEIIKELVSIFKVEFDKDTIEYSISILRYKEARIIAENNQKEKQSKSDSLYREYLNRYDTLVNLIIENPTNKSKIQAIISEIENQYSLIFQKDYRNFFYKIKDVSPLAVLCLLMNKFTRKFFILDGEMHSDLGLFEQDVKGMYDSITNQFKDINIEALGEHVIKKNNETGNRFVTLTDKKCLVIKLFKIHGSECSISKYSDNEDFLTPKEINGKFLIMDGLQYQSQDSRNTLYYIEI